MAFKGGDILGTITLNTSGSGNSSIGTGSNTGTVAIGNSTLTAVNIVAPTNINVAGALNTAIGSTSNTGTVAIGNTSSTSVTIIGPTNINTTAANNTAINSTSSSGTVSIGNTSSGVISIDCGTAGIVVGTTANAHSSTFGSTNSTSSTTVQSGSGALALTSTGGTWTGNSGTGALGLSTDGSATTISIGTGGAVKTVTLGSTNSTSTTTVACGTGGANFGTSANAHATVIGSTTAASTTTIQAPSAGVILTGVQGVAVSNRNYVTINTATGAIGSDNAPLTSISITGDSGGALTGSSFTFTGGTTGLTFAGAGTTETLGGTLVVSNGGTGRATLTNHGVLVGAGTTAITQLAVGATNSVLQGTTGADPAFTTTPTVTSITFGAGSALSTFTDWTTFTPTVVGATVAGTTTYTNQSGFYSRIGNIVICQFQVTYSAATGTGNLTIGGLPFTINNTSGYIPTGIILVTGLTWPAGTTYPILQGTPNTTNAVVNCIGSAVGNGLLQMANASVIIYGFLTYRV